ncbi:MAG: DegV family protein [Oscillospiraceae bacterium]|nr:DegV family protein [Oscillospiraceae bacterium]
MSVRIVVDSTCDLVPALRERVSVAPLTVHFGDTDYVDGVTLTAHEFYEKLASSKDMPSTSQANPVVFGELFEEAVNAGDEVVCICCSSRLSGTFQSARIAADDFPEKVFVVDTLNIALSSAIMAEYALQLADAGKGAKEIADELYAVRDKVRLFAVVDTLEFLQRGGRVSRTVALAGGLLSIKPIIGIVDGKVEMVGKARGNKAANRQMNQEVEKLGVDLTKPVLLGYTGVDDSLLKKYMTECEGFWPEDAKTMIVSGVVGAHAGPGAVAVAFFAK